MSTERNPFLLDPDLKSPLDDAGDALESDVSETETPFADLPTSLSIGRINFDLTEGNPLVIAGAAALVLADNLAHQSHDFRTLAEVRPSADAALQHFAAQMADHGSSEGTADIAALGYAALAERYRMTSNARGSKSIYFAGGLLEGTETILFLVVLYRKRSFFWLLSTHSCFGIFEVSAREEIVEASPTI